MEILFRAKSIENGAWIYGSLCNDPYRMEAEICDHDYVFLPRKDVDPDTVGQYIGLCDMYGNKIFEGDIVRCGEFVYEVTYSFKYASFGLCRKQDVFMHYFGEAMNADECEVIGNIYDTKKENRNE